ncbi:hypothetical protein ACMHYJ_14035 [Castellaniella hirudinis]|uniref:hypothetical protein n=1 Tax=Castellaniella hirudinis TaxID=1144617 RepID=UPI0039C0A7C1
MEGFNISTLSDAFALAVRADGKEISGERIASLLAEAAKENDREVEAGHLPITAMYLIFADFSDKLGRELGHEIDPEGFALDWADDYPQLRRACAQVEVLVVQTMSDAGRLFREVSGFGPEDVFVRMMQDETTAEVAAAQLESERQRPTIH